MKKIVLVSLFMLSVFFYMSDVSYGVPAAPAVYEFTQPDGTVISARQWGDEWLHGWETADGYSVIRDKNTGNWTYAETDADGRLVSSAKIVGKFLDTDNLQKHLRPTGNALLKILSLRPAPSAIDKVIPPSGTANIPVFLINFNDTTTAYTVSDFDTLLFGTGNNSMKDYYEEVSYGAFSVSAGPSGIAGWISAANTHDYYGRNDIFGFDKWPGTLVREAVAAADGAFDFAPYDQDGDCYVDVVNIIHQGSGEEAGGPATDIWSHSWDLNSAYFFRYSDGGEYVTNDACPAGGFIKVNDYVIQPETLWDEQQTMGVFAHEYGHALGLPDLYDTDYSSEAIGEWGLMAAGSWNYVSFPGDRPSHMSAWSKYALGWVTPTQVTGTMTAEPIQQASANADVYQFLPGSPSTGGEYFLVENRQRAGFDAGLPGDGLLIWHIDESRANNNKECYPPADCTDTHYRVSVEQADAEWDLEKGINSGDNGDPFPGSAVNTSFTGATSPNSNLYNNTPTNVSVTNISSSGATMNATLSIEPPITLLITPPLLTTVAPGDVLGPFTVTATNNTASYYPFNVFRYVIMPDSAIKWRGPVSAGLSGDQTVAKEESLVIPAGANDGYYTYGVMLTDTIGNEIANDSFDFTIANDLL